TRVRSWFPLTGGGRHRTVPRLFAFSRVSMPVFRAPTDTRPMSQVDRSASGLLANLDTEVGKIVVDTGLATSHEIDYCREQQKQSSDPNQRSLADLLVENNFITPTQARRIKGQLEDRKGSQIPGYQL